KMVVAMAEIEKAVASGFTFQQWEIKKGTVSLVMSPRPDKFAEGRADAKGIGISAPVVPPPGPAPQSEKPFPDTPASVWRRVKPRTKTRLTGYLQRMLDAGFDPRKPSEAKKGCEWLQDQNPADNGPPILRQWLFGNPEKKIDPKGFPPVTLERVKLP